MYDLDYLYSYAENLTSLDGSMIDPKSMLGDGVNYSDLLLWQSPEGNIYGQTRIVQNYTYFLVWDGVHYHTCNINRYVMDISVMDNVAKPFDYFVGVPKVGENVLKESITDNYPHLFDTYYYSALESDWKAVTWLSDISNLSDIPYPGLITGGGHAVTLKHVQVMWDGYNWVPFPKHSNLLNDEPDLHLPPGLIRSLVSSSFELTFISKKEISLIRSGKDTGVLVNGVFVTVNNQSIHPQDGFVSLFTPDLVVGALEANQEYYVYLSNNNSMFRSVGGKSLINSLFLSKQEPINGVWGGSSEGKNAIIVGRIETDNDCNFRQELNISWISNRASLVEAFRDVCDFRLTFKNEKILCFEKLANAYGNIYIPEELKYLSSDYEISNSSYWLSLDSNEQPVLNTSAISSGKKYCYIANEVDAFNFNTINAATNRPWQASDFDAATNYNADKDFRLKPFLSSSPPDHNRLAETWPCFYTRFLGDVNIDANGNFLASVTMSAVNSANVNPQDVTGLAEIQIKTMSDSEFQIVKSKGTSGIVYVNGKSVQSLEDTDTNVWKIRTDSTVYDYDETFTDNPLKSSGIVSDKINITLYVYLANDTTSFGNWPVWGSSTVNYSVGDTVKHNSNVYKCIYSSGSKTNAPSGTIDTNTWWFYLNAASSSIKQFICLDAPTNGYLSTNHPGINARWICTIRTDANGKFTGSYIIESIANLYVILNDSIVDLGKTWSSQKIETRINSQIQNSKVSASETWSSSQIVSYINTMLKASGLWDYQVLNGLDLRLDYINSSTLRISPYSTSTIDIAFKVSGGGGYTSRRMTSPQTVNIAGSTGSIYYVYLTLDGYVVTTSAPNEDYSAMKTRDGGTKLFVGVYCPTSTNAIQGGWNVSSYYNYSGLSYTTGLALEPSLSKDNIVRHYSNTSSANTTVYTQYKVAAHSAVVKVSAQATIVFNICCKH